MSKRRKNFESGSILNYIKYGNISNDLDNDDARSIKIEIDTGNVQVRLIIDNDTKAAESHFLNFIHPILLKVVVFVLMVEKELMLQI